MKFRKKPVVIEAEQFTGDNVNEIVKFVGVDAKVLGRTKELKISTLEGLMNVSPGDWVIQGVQGEFYPCKPDIFEATYEEVE